VAGSNVAGSNVAGSDAASNSEAAGAEADRREDEVRVRVRLDLGYDGTDFSGWAAQPGRRTVAGALGDTLTLLVGPDGATGLTVAGRTDAGVHATGQVCHVDMARDRWTPLQDSLVRRLAGLLPPDIRVYGAYAVPPSFDARFSAVFRRYAYRVADSPWGAPPLRHRDTLAWPRPLDLAALNAASAGLVGQHDFAAYCRRKEYASTVRTICDLRWRREPDGVVVATVAADAFCQAMVRSLIGALLRVGDGRRGVAWPSSLLAREERASEVVVAPPQGLTLVGVGYPSDPGEYGRRAELTRQRRG
jgi:tRNA pseudouridine38-40 synthase